MGYIECIGLRAPRNKPVLIALITLRLLLLLQDKRKNKMVDLNSGT